MRLALGGRLYGKLRLLAVRVLDEIRLGKVDPAEVGGALGAGEIAAFAELIVNARLRCAVFLLNLGERYNVVEGTDKLRLILPDLLLRLGEVGRLPDSS